MDAFSGGVFLPVDPPAVSERCSTGLPPAAFLAIWHRILDADSHCSFPRPVYRRLSIRQAHSVATAKQREHTSRGCVKLTHSLSLRWCEQTGKHPELHPSFIARVAGWTRACFHRKLQAQLRGSERRFTAYS